MSYGPDPFDNFRRSASYVDRNLQVSQAGRSFRSAANEVPPSFGKSLFAPDCVVADAVGVEPVSASNFPANREINREISRILLLNPTHAAKFDNECSGLDGNSLLVQTGNIFQGTGNLQRKNRHPKPRHKPNLKSVTVVEPSKSPVIKAGRR